MAQAPVTQEQADILATLAKAHADGTAAYAAHVATFDAASALLNGSVEEQYLRGNLTTSVSGLQTLGSELQKEAERVRDRPSL